MEITRKREAERLVGRKIVRVELNRFDSGRGYRVSNPTIYLDDGSSLCFSACEGEIDDGVAVLHVRPDKKGSSK